MKKCILITICFAIYSCTCKQVNLTKNEKEWLNPYKKGDILIFKSNLGSIDTVKVIDKTEFITNENCQWLTIGDTQNQGINIDLKPNICHNKFYCKGEVSIIKSNVDDETAPFFRIFGLEFSKNVDRLIKRKVVLSTTGKVYKSAYLFQDKINADNSGNNYMKTFFWDKIDGLIKYESNDGEIFEVTNR
ncbi:hypothetical protein [Flavobacterium sp. Root901]|uniref:hypothetical protein n=1 Tax=Flavobacterium sp. Root901 TaxID=1736605 RepID=UPI000ADF965A|nr:hypothetical protein [Flavobacterium sp. Root901]